MPFMPKQQVLAQVAQAINRPDVPWAYSVQGDAVVGFWKWRDAVFFAPGQVGTDIQEYTFTVTLADDGTYKERDRTAQSSTSVGSGAGGGLTLSSNKSSSVGSVRMKFYALAPGIDQTTGQAGLIRTAFDTEWVKDPLRAYLNACGWTKAKGLFGRLMSRQ